MRSPTSWITASRPSSVTDADHAGDVESLVGTVASLKAAVVAPGERWNRLKASAPARLVGRKAGGPGLAVLHQRHDRTAQGRHAHAPQPADGDAQLLRRHRPGDAAGLHPPRRAAFARFGALRAASRGPGGGERRAAVRRRRRRRDRGPPAALAGDVVVRRSHHGEAAGRRPGHRCRGPLPPEDDHLRRRTDVFGRPGGRPRRLRPPPGPDLRAGRDADDDHGPVQGRPRRSEPSPLAGPHAECRRAPHRRRGPSPRRRRPRTPGWRDWRGGGPGRRGHGRLLEPARCHG